jgi:hypothetical protein
MKRLMTGIGVFGIALGLFTSPALAFRCPLLIKQATDAMAKTKAEDGKVKQAKELVAEARRLHDAGQHGESVKKANEALGLLGVKGSGYSY